MPIKTSYLPVLTYLTVPIPFKGVKLQTLQTQHCGEARTPGSQNIDLKCSRENLQNVKNLQKLENVAIANVLQLEAARRLAVPIHFNFVAHAKFGEVVRHSLAYLAVHKWLVGDIPFYLKYWAKVTHPLQKRRLPIDIRS